MKFFLKKCMNPNLPPQKEKVFIHAYISKNPLLDSQHQI